MQAPTKGTEPGVRSGKRSLLACHTRFKFSMEITHNRLRSSSVWRLRTRMSFNIRERDTSYCWVRSPYRPKKFLNDDFKRSARYPCLSSLLESRLALSIKHSYEEQARAYRISWEIKLHRLAKMEYYYSGTESLWFGNWNHLVCRRSKCEDDHPSQSTVVNPGKKQKWCSLWRPWSQVQQDTSGPDNSGLFMDNTSLMYL